MLFQIVSGVALLGSITAFGGWVYRSKIRRISALADRLRALERREYDAGPSVEGAAEWRRIDDALDRLSSALARREQMLLVLNRILRHNLRNGLNVVGGRAAGLEERLDDDERESAREIRSVTDELLELADRARTTEALLDPIVEHRPRTDLAAVVRDRVDRFVDDHDGSISDVTVRVPDQAVAVCGGEAETAVDELLANVVDHAGPEPTVDIAVEDDGDHVRIRVADDGPGIPDEEVDVITGTRPISQVTHTGGIGLWLVDWIASRYDGRLLIPPTDSATASADGDEADDGPDGATVVLEFPSASNRTASDAT
ncbi:HAMP domain-containing sensor histidine kinase [Natronolimnohabitans sp. A-GB9]|uniref:sensor histidine kinase n=1 Tax=Natronolimnohabitans sp. A-GB9 TaxID=3069757 RepID=UPI0027B0F49A|nr:HAMP domain-containing sensor histidine kinase [Natronolimnohabitans sp. A-GB9]MDQ2051619.1 HAMP domain-containing sensor histidine kinase [Natronolimnohabitans sp. A-GB9]